MNGIGRIFKEVKSNWQAMELLPAPYNEHKVKYWFDSLYCLVKYGALADDYISLLFYSKNAEERRKYVTSGNKRLFYKNFMMMRHERYLLQNICLANGLKTM